MTGEVVKEASEVAAGRYLDTPVDDGQPRVLLHLVVAEALECLGGNGYVEESQLPRLFRESPLNSIWEGSGNVAALDVLRASLKEGKRNATVLLLGLGPYLDGVTVTRVVAAGSKS